MPQWYSCLRYARVALALILVILAPSCSGGPKPVFPVRGEVVDTQKKPAVGAMIVFNSVNPASNDLPKPVGHVGPDGKFSLTTYKEGDGAPAGDYVLTITWQTPKKTPLDPEGADKLQGRYANLERSRLRFTVESKSDNEIPPIKLE